MKIKMTNGDLPVMDQKAEDMWIPSLDTEQKLDDWEHAAAEAWYIRTGENIEPSDISLVFGEEFDRALCAWRQVLFMDDDIEFEQRQLEETEAQLAYLRMARNAAAESFTKEWC